MKRNNKKMKLDPRTALFLLGISNVTAFLQDNSWLEISWIILLILLLTYTGHAISGVKWFVIYIAILGLQYYILPVAPKTIAMCFTIFANYSRRMIPCLLVGAIIIKNISLREMVAGFRKMHFPEKIIVPISVTIRYFPAIKEEVGHIHEAMVLRYILISDRIEAMVVPVMLSATETAEELSQAAVTRGIENPNRKTSGVLLHMKMIDYCCICISVCFVFLTIFVGGTL